MNKWYIPDAFFPGVSSGKTYVSHEAVCFLNETAEDAQVSLTLYFEDRDKMTGFHAVVPAERTVHLRLDRLKRDDGVGIPQDTPYAIVIESETALTFQSTLPLWGATCYKGATTGDILPISIHAPLVGSDH